MRNSTFYFTTINITKTCSLIIFLLLCTRIVSHGQQSQNIDLSFAQTPLKEVLNHLEKNYGYNISYSSNTININQKITIEVKQVSIVETLKVMLEGLPISYHIANKRIILKYNDLRQTIRGNVIDADSQSPIFGAAVSVIGSDPILGSITDMEGNFRIENVPVGRKSIRMNYLGYEEVIISNILLGAGKELVLNIQSAESIIKMEAVIISATGIRPDAINEMAVVSGRSFTVEETKRFPTSMGDPLRLASSFAGVLSTDDESNEIVVRGNTPRGILWKLEGVEIPNPNHFSSEGASGGGVSMFSTQVISRSDFFTGAFAAEYGNATSGVFDIHLRKGNNEQREYTLQAGFLGLNIAAEGPFQKGKKSSFLINYRYSTLGILTNMGVIDLGDNQTNIFQDLSFKMSFPTKSLGTFTVFGMGGLSNAEAVFPNEFFGKEQYQMGVAGVSNTYIINKNTFVKTTISMSGTDLIDEEIERDPEEEFITKFSKNYTRASVLLNKKINSKNLLELGFTHSLLHYSFKETIFIAPTEDTELVDIVIFNDKGNSGTEQAFASWKYKINNKLSLVNGAHFLHFNLTGESSIEPRASIKWQLTDRKSVYAGYGLHSRIESLEYYFGNFINQDGTTTDYNRNLGLSKSRHFVIGYDTQVGEFAYFKTELYYQSLFNVPVLSDTISNAYSTLNFSEGYTSLPLSNNGTGTNYGIEFTLERKFAKDFYYLINASFYDSKYKGSDGIERNTRFNGKFNYNILAGKEFKVGNNGKNNIFGISMKMAHAGNKRITPIDLAASRLAGEEVRNFGDPYTAKHANYFRFDLQISFRKNKKKRTSEWRLDIQNLSDKQNVTKQFYQRSSGKIVNVSAFGLIPLLSYRMEF